MRPVSKGVRTIGQYVGDTAINAYNGYIDGLARAAAGTTHTRHHHQTAAASAVRTKTRDHHNGIVAEIDRQIPLQRAAHPLDTWIYTSPARADDYGDARLPLRAVIGGYCSFCERRIPQDIHVEHRAPKDVYPLQRLDWANFILACPTCNSIKGTKHKVVLLHGGRRWVETTEVTYCFWPDKLTPERNRAYAQDSFNVLQYGENGTVRIHPSVPDGPTKDRVLATIAMVGLDRVLDQTRSQHTRMWFSTNGDGTYAETWDNYEISNQAPSGGLMTNAAAMVTPGIVPILGARDQSTLVQRYGEIGRDRARFSDLRAPQRYEVWQVAERARREYDKLLVDNPKNILNADAQNVSLEEFNGRIRVLTGQILAGARDAGYWSVWVTVFRNRGESTRFKRRPAIIPVLRGLLSTDNFPGTRPHTDFSPRIYTDVEEARWGAEVRRKELAHQSREEAELAAQVRQEQTSLALQDDVEMLQQDVYRLEVAVAAERRRNARLVRDGNELLAERNALRLSQGRLQHDLQALDDEAAGLREQLRERGVELFAAGRDRDAALAERNHARAVAEQEHARRQQAEAQLADANEDIEDIRLERDQAQQARDEALQARDAANNNARALYMRLHQLRPFEYPLR